MSKLEVIKLTKEDKKLYYPKLAAFNCGEKDINKWLSKFDKVSGTTFIFMLEKDIVGYATICTTCLQKLVKKGIKSFSAVEVKLFAISKNYQHKIFIEDMNYSEYLFKWVINYILKIDALVSIYYIVLHSVNTNVALKFYHKLGFIELEENLSSISETFNRECIPMFFSLK